MRSPAFGRRLRLRWKAWISACTVKKGTASKGDAMKKIEAVIQPHKFDDVKASLINIGINGMTVSEVRGHGRQKGHKEVYRGMEYQVDLLPKVKIEVVVPSDRLEEVIRALSAAAKTGKIG